MAVIRKVGAVILSDDRQRMVVVRKKGKSVFIIPGGKPEGTESDVEALKRELREELNIELQDCSFLGEYAETAAFGEGSLILRVYDVVVSGHLSVDNEIEEAVWIGSDYQEQGIAVASGLSHHVVPALAERGDLH